MKVIFGHLWFRLHVNHSLVLVHQIKKLVVTQKHLKLTNISFSVLVKLHVDTLTFNTVRYAA